MKPRDNALTRDQRAICETFGSAFTPPDALQKVGLALTTIGMQPIYGVRTDVREDVSGRYIWCGEYAADDDFFASVHVSHLDTLLASVLPYLALAPGFKFIIDAEGYRDVWFDPTLLTVSGKDSGEQRQARGLDVS